MWMTRSIRLLALTPFSNIQWDFNHFRSRKTRPPPERTARPCQKPSLKVSLFRQRYWALFFWWTIPVTALCHISRTNNRLTKKRNVPHYYKWLLLALKKNQGNSVEANTRKCSIVQTNWKPSKGVDSNYLTKTFYIYGTTRERYVFLPVSVLYN